MIRLHPARAAQYIERTMNDIAIRAERVYKSFGDLQAVEDLSFQVQGSTCYAFLGPNGAGKTTMMSMVYGRARRDPRPDSRLRVFGYDPESQSLQIKYLSGVVPQENNLDVELSVERNLFIYARFYRVDRRSARARIDRLLEFMELGDKKGAKIRELSGGMKRRLLIARALLNEPRLLILDEPTTGLDPQVRHLIWEKLRQLKREGTTILLTTHYMDEAFQLADTVLIMNLGRKLLEGDPRRLMTENIEQHVLEIRTLERVSMLQEILRVKRIRQERYHGSTLLYADDPSMLKGIAENLNPRDYYLRQTNLEDLFLKLTGRELYEKQ
jgi:lipooligosaccharide transport system ATP-binding protein